MEYPDLVRKAGRGDKDALIRLVMERKDDYYRLAFVYLRNQDDSLDALQDMIVILYENIQKLQKPEAFYSWSKTILVNCCKKVLRKKRRFPLLEGMEEIEDDKTSDLESYHRQQDILRALHKLNSHQQEAIKLRYFLDWDYESIAQATGTPLGTVKSRISTGLAKLRGSLGGEY